MKESIISYKVMRMKGFGGDSPSIYYKVACDCGETDHILTACLDHEQNYVTLTLSQNIAWSSYYGRQSWFGRLKSRIINATKVLFQGYLVAEGSLILNGEEHIKNFITALEEGKEYVKEAREESEKPKQTY